MGVGVEVVVSVVCGGSVVAVVAVVAVVSVVSGVVAVVPEAVVVAVVSVESVGAVVSSAVPPQANIVAVKTTTSKRASNFFMSVDPFLVKL